MKTAWTGDDDEGLRGVMVRSRTTFRGGTGFPAMQKCGSQGPVLQIVCPFVPSHGALNDA